MTIAGPLGRREPTDFEHVTKYPLSALPAEQTPTAVPVVIGVNWYTAFDTPERDNQGRYWIARNGNLGSIRGGHAVCLEPQRSKLWDRIAWWAWYNQVSEGICVSEAVARCQTLLNRRRYQPRPLYDIAQTIDEWPGEAYSGTSVRAGLDVARERGLIRARRGERHHVGRGEVPAADTRWSTADGIAANRWATSIDEVLSVLGTPDADSVVLLNSWGTAYPHRVRMPATVLDRLLNESGEIAIVTDR